MTLPFIDLFKNMKARLFPAAGQAKPSPTPVVRAEKSMSDRLSKTVLPSKARERMPMSIEAPLPGSPGAIPAPQKISLDSSRKAPRSSVKFAAAQELQAERAISLQLSDILDQLPADTIKPKESFDPSRAIVLKATEVEKGMASGKPSVSLASIYQQAPEIFTSNISPDDGTPILLPFTKVLDQFAKLQVRADQVSEQAVPQLETPFLAVTLEDTERFGTTMKPIEASAAPPVKVQTATAESLSAAEPEPAVREVTRSGKPPLSRPVISLRDLDAVGSTSAPAGALAARSEEKQQDPPSISPQKIPFHLPPNGTGESASERVPASSGPPVPIVPAEPKPSAVEKDQPAASPAKPEDTSSSKSAETAAASKTEPPAGIPLKLKMPASAEVKSSEQKDQPAASPAKPEDTSSSTSAETVVPSKPAPPARIPFKFKSPSDDIRPKFTLVPGVEPKEKAAQPIKLNPTNDDPKIALPLQALLQQLPAFQLHGSPMSVGEEVQIRLPLSLIEPQLASGRVMVGARVFHRAIPELHRQLFVIDQNETPVMLPLQEILKHLPSNALRPRADQEDAVKIRQEFTTPFSIQADEDAKRFDAMAAVASKTSADPAVESETGEKTPIETKDAPDRTVAEAIEIKKESAEEKVQPQPSETKSEEVDVKQVVAQATALPGVGACAISFSDGLSLAGNIPVELGAEGICAMTPSLWQRIGNHMHDTKLGSLRSMTLHCADSALTFFMEGDICLTAVHAGGMDLCDTTQSELVTIVKKLSRTYAQPEINYTGHHGKD